MQIRVDQDAVVRQEGPQTESRCFLEVVWPGGFLGQFRNGTAAITSRLGREGALPCQPMSQILPKHPAAHAISWRSRQDTRRPAARSDSGSRRHEEPERSLAQSRSSADRRSGRGSLDRMLVIERAEGTFPPVPTAMSSARRNRLQGQGARAYRYATLALDTRVSTSAPIYRFRDSSIVAQARQSARLLARVAQTRALY